MKPASAHGVQKSITTFGIVVLADLQHAYNQTIGSALFGGDTHETE